MAASTSTDAPDAGIIPILANAKAKKENGQIMENKGSGKYDIIAVADLYQQAGCLFEYAYNAYSQLAQMHQQAKDPISPNASTSRRSIFSYIL
eukprot:CAMPEP_0114670878 /NCGR_PEP_ID=MMETSP0191-20121206/40167_1 /TAXON_ID=126664 /ORGANISM="Sorites sp." /LENGTH=92 /DNA_ID=CAMNT_0001929299 /DNA_START=142 /DNA_END=420 /DNA_ORIENTATION=+